jgi:hypothetical protein
MRIRPTRRTAASLAPLLTLLALAARPWVQVGEGERSHTLTRAFSWLGAGFVKYALPLLLLLVLLAYLAFRRRR